MREPRLTHNSIVEVLVCVVCCVLLSSCCCLEVLLFSNFLLLCVQLNLGFKQQNMCGHVFYICARVFYICASVDADL